MLPFSLLKKIGVTHTGRCGQMSIAHHVYGNQSEWSKVVYEFSDIAQSPALPQSKRAAIMTMVDVALGNPQHPCDSSGWLTGELRKF